MAKLNILELNVPTLFENHSISEIIDIEKSVDTEIERKRVELRSIVGDRYKDILTATEAIKSIESISETIVREIESVLGKCDDLVKQTKTVIPTKPAPVNKDVMDERTILMQVRLAIELNEQIWIAIDDGNFCNAAQFYLLAQHVHTGLRLMRKDMIVNYRLTTKLKIVVDLLRSKILQGSLDRLKNVELSIEDTCSLLNSIMLLENHSTSDLLLKFVEIRKSALEFVISETYSSVRMQIAAMIKCIYTSIQLLHDCFFNYKETKEGLLWSELHEIVDKTSPCTITKLALPSDKMHTYIPEVIKQFRPKCSNVEGKLMKPEALIIIAELLVDFTQIVRKGLAQHLQLVPNIKGLYLVREEALKIDAPPKWEEICVELDLARNFDVWYYFFQDVMTQRVQFLISSKHNEHSQSLCNNVARALIDEENITKESDLRWYIWSENCLADDQKVLSMKTRGFSPVIVKLCQDFDDRCLELLRDVSLYLYGREYNTEDDMYGRMPSQVVASDRKFIDREKLEGHLKDECSKCINELVNHLKQEVSVTEQQIVMKSVICARLLTALSYLCPSFHKCCCCNHSTDEWDRINQILNVASLHFWDNWIRDCNAKMITFLKDSFDITESRQMLITLCKWDTIEIQEQTDEKIFKSQIKIPMKSTRALERALDALTAMLNALFPHTLPKQVHLKFLELNVLRILDRYEAILAHEEKNQMQALQFLFDVKFLTTLTVPRENMALMQRSQDVCDKFRALVDPFDLDVFYKYLQHNVRQNALQTQVIYGCLLPSSNQLASLGVLEKNKEHEKDPSILALSTPANNNWFLLLPVTAPTTKTNHQAMMNADVKVNTKEKPKKNHESSVRAGAAALFGAMATDWFS